MLRAGVSDTVFKHNVWRLVSVVPCNRRTCVYCYSLTWLISRTLPAVTADRVTLSFGKSRALDDLSIMCPGGISFGLLGPNGAGKTTLIRVLVGLLRPRSGSVRILGRQPSRETALSIGYMPQLQSLYGELSVRQNVTFFAHIYRMRRRS